MDKSSSSGHFFKGFFKGAGNSALMMGIFSLMHGLAGSFGLIEVAAGTSAFLPIALPLVGVMVLSIGMFGGYMAMRHASETSHLADTVTRERARVDEVARSIEPQVGVVAERGPQAGPRWADRTGRRSSADNIQNILADGSMGDKDRASAILRERELASSTEQAR